MAGLARQRISFTPPKLSGAHVPHASKRHLLEGIEKSHGLGAIVRIADALDSMPPEPVLLALTRATSMQDLLARWRRMERFSHSRHFIDMEVKRSNRITIRHRAHDPEAPPVRCESALVIAVIILLCERVTAGPLVVTSGDGQTVRAERRWTNDLAGAWSGRFTLEAETATRGRAVTSSHARLDEAELLDQLIARDPVRRWSIRDMAAQLGISGRTLQRRLRDRQTTASEIIRRARLNLAAARLLETPGTSLAEIGFLCGFSDQAHFTRTFADHVGTTPRAYRTDFVA